MKPCKIACIQTNTQDILQDNIRTVEKQVREAAALGACFICLPENVFLMVDTKTTKIPYPATSEHQGVIDMQALAKELSVWILIGSVAVKSTVEAKGLNRSILINDKGEIVSHYDKIHLFDVTLPNGETHAESSRFEAGNQAVLAQTPWGKVGLTICYDVRFPHLYRCLAKAGAAIITVPAAFTKLTGKIHWHVLLRARAIENGCFIVAPAQGGTHPGGRETFGHSVIIDPWGRVLTEQQHTTGIIIAELNLEEVAKARSAIPALTHDRVFE